MEAGLAPGDDHSRASKLLAALGLSGEENPAHLSGGEARRAALARALAPNPDILILDEPTNHLDLPAIEWLEEEIARSRSALVLVSHDRRLLERRRARTLWLDRGAVRRLDRGFAAFEAWRDEVFAQEERDRQKLDRKIAAELDWLRYGVTARRSRNQGRLRALNELRRKRREQLRVAGKVKFTLADAKTSGKLVIEAEGFGKALGGRMLVRDFSIRIARGDRHRHRRAERRRQDDASEPPDRREPSRTRDGAARRQSRHRLARPAPRQPRSDDDAEGGADPHRRRHGDDRRRARHVMSYMKDFLFAPEQAEQPVSALSGGERGRLMLARAWRLPSNLLVLDEPTNDLDLETLDLLQEMIADYPGTVILVSHDRDFLDRTVTSIVVAEGDGRWIEYAGGYSDMLAQRGAAPVSSPTETAAREAGARAGEADGRSRATPRSASSPSRTSTRWRRCRARSKRCRRTLASLGAAARRSGLLRKRPAGLRARRRRAEDRRGGARGGRGRMAQAVDAARGNRGLTRGFPRIPRAMERKSAGYLSPSVWRAPARRRRQHAHA